MKYWSENAAGFNLADTSSAIALTEHCSPDDAHWYRADCEAASHSDIVLTSHTCSMLYSRGVNVFKHALPLERPLPAARRPLPEKEKAQAAPAFTGSGQREAGGVHFAYLIADEADRMPEAAESILRLRSSPRRISSILQEFQEAAGWKRSDTKKACESLLGLQRVLDESGALFTDTHCILSKELPDHGSLSYINSVKAVMHCLQPLSNCP